MLSKSTLKYINSFSEKKTRQKEGFFLVEGAKGILETIDANLEIEHLLLTDHFLATHAVNLPYFTVSQDVLNKTGTLKNNNAGIALVKMPSWPDISSQKGTGLILYDISDPGNLGSIVRLADWYGIDYVVCSENTVDLYNPKTIAASMGSFTRVAVYYTDLPAYLEKTKLPIYGALLSGENIYEEQFDKNSLFLIGNESKGISADIQKYITRPITIPRVGMAESLNAAIATGIILDNYRRVMPKG